MAYFSTLGLGEQLIGGRRHLRPKSKVAKTRCKFGSRFEFKPYGRKRKQMGKGIREKPKRGNDCCDLNEVKVISNTGCSGSSTSIFNPNDDVTIEILSRLPAKSLMRFKCVCKNWFFLIQNDTTFIDLHFERSKAQPRLLVNIQIDIEKFALMTFDMFGVRSDGSVSAAAVHTVREIDFKYDKMLKPVNGLIGFLGETRMDPGVCIYNLSTQEITPWVESELLRDVRKKEHEEFKDLAMATCALGYDPASKEYKVVGIWMSLRPYYTVCEVMTVGDNIWRQIDQVPPYNLQLHGSYVYINGLIYYRTVSLSMSRVIDMDKAKFIVVFDVGREEFRTIRVPNYIFAQPADHQAYYVFYYVRLLELEGRLGLLIKLRGSSTLKLWLLDDDENKKNSTNSWTQVTTELPNILEDDVHGVSYDLVSGTNKVILNSYAKTSDGKISGTTYHSYNRKNKSFNKIEISGIPSSVPFFTTESTVETFSEHLLPVQKHTSERN